MILRFAFLLILFVFANAVAAAQTTRLLRIAILDVSEKVSSKFSEQLIESLQQINFKLIDKDLARAAATGTKTTNAFNLTLEEAKNLGLLFDCNFFIVLKSETVRRSSFQTDVYFESNAIMFLVSAQTGHLIGWTDKYFEAETPDAAENKLLAETKKITAEFSAKIVAAAKSERAERADNLTNTVILIEDLPNETAAAAQNFRVPLPYKRLRPEYTEAARRRNVEATVDVAAELNERGEVERTEVVRWAGFNLDEAAADAVKKMQFRPALRDEKPLAIRILLRYNFRDLQKQ